MPALRSDHRRLRAMQVNILKAVLLKLASALLFAVMSALVRYVSDVTPVGAGGVLPLGLRDHSGGGDLRLAAAS